jgi:hypothetical protein
MPTPMPALAPVPRPVIWSGDAVEVDVGRLCVEAGVAGVLYPRHSHIRVWCILTLVTCTDAIVDTKSVD